MRRADYMASIVRRVGKLSTDALRYLAQWSFPLDIIPILKAYDDGGLLRKVDCDMEVALAMEEIVRCRDCNSASFDEFGGGWCNENCREIKAWNFCSWGARREP